MSFLSSIGGSSLFSIAAQAALAVATGGTSLVVQAAMRSVMMAVGDKVIQQLGQKLGLPQEAIDLAQAAFHAYAGDTGGAVKNLQEAVGGFTQATGGNEFDQAALQQTADNSVRDTVNQLLRNIQENAQNTDGEGGGRTSSATSGKGDSFLVAFAKALGKAIDSKMNRMMEVSEKIDQQTQAANSSGGKRQAVIGELSAELQGLSQEVSFLSAALANSVKSLGEATSTLARKS